MKKLILLTLLAFSFLIYADQKHMFTTANNGLVLREKPTIKSKRMGLIPYGTKVDILGKTKKQVTIAKKTSNWFKVRYNNKSGWVFGGFLSDKPVSDNIITNKSAGNISIGDSINDIKKLGYKITKSTEDAGEGTTTTVYSIYDGKEKLLKVYPENSDEGLNAKVIEIQIISKRYKTSEGIGVGSKLTDFLKTYSDNSFWYTYVSEKFVAETKSYTGIQFLINGYSKSKNKLGRSDMDILTSSDFSSRSKIISIRVY